MSFLSCCSSSWLLVLLFFTTALAQGNDYKGQHPQSREPQFTISPTGKASVARAALDVLVDGLDPSSGVVTNPSPGLDTAQSATFIQTLSRYDQLAGNTTYESHALAAFVAFQNQNPKLSPTTVHSDTARWGLAAYYASTVYDGSTRESFLEGAKAAWDLLQAFQLTPEIASSGHLASINATFESTCNGSSVAGAVLWLERGDVLTNSETMGPFIALSSYLYNQTHNQSYADAAELAIGFMQTFLANNGTGPTLDSIYLHNCTTDQRSFAYNSGYFIEGLAAHIASTGDGSLQGYLTGLVSSVLKESEWQRPDGVLMGDTFKDSDYSLVRGTNPDPTTLLNSRLISDWKSIYLNGLYTCLRLGLLSTQQAQFASGFIAIQYNAIRQLANSTVNGTIAYSPSWNNQPLQVLTAWGQLAAAEVLTIAMNVTTKRDTATDTSWIHPPGSPSNPSSTFYPWPTGAGGVGMPPGPGTVAASSSSSPVGAIVGGVVGGLGGLAFIALIVLFFLKRRRNPRPRKVTVNPFSSTDSTHTNSTIEPFLLPGPTIARTPPTQQVLGTDGRVTKLQAQRYGPTPSEGGWSARPPGSYAPDPAYGDPDDGAGPSGARGTLDEQRIHSLLTRLTNVLAQVGRLEERRSRRISGQRRRDTARSPPVVVPAVDEEKGYGW